MAKLSAHGPELYRYFSFRKQGLISVRSDKVALIKYPGTGWKLCFKAKAGTSEADWAQTWAYYYGNLAQ
jgi:hypothetical protein